MLPPFSWHSVSKIANVFKIYPTKNIVETSLLSSSLVNGQNSKFSYFVSNFDKIHVSSTRIYVLNQSIKERHQRSRQTCFEYTVPMLLSLLTPI